MRLCTCYFVLSGFFLNFFLSFFLIMTSAACSDAYQMFCGARCVLLEHHAFPGMFCGKRVFLISRATFYKSTEKHLATKLPRKDAMRPVDSSAAPQSVSVSETYFQWQLDNTADHLNLERSSLRFEVTWRDDS